MLTRLFVVYLLAETAALVALVSTIGFGRTVLVALAAFAVGLAVAGSQAKRQLLRLRSGVHSGWSALSDSMLVALGTVLVVVPGLVTTAMGLLLLLPATRAVTRPVLTALAVGGLGRRAPLIDTVVRDRRDFIDGEVIGVRYEEPPVTPVGPAT